MALYCILYRWRNNQCSSLVQIVHLPKYSILLFLKVFRANGTNLKQRMKLPNLFDVCDLSSAALTGVIAVGVLGGGVCLVGDMSSCLVTLLLKNEPFGGFSRSLCLLAMIVSAHTRYCSEVNLEPCFCRSSSTVSSTRSAFS